jgi:hypothetical protein
MTEDSRRLISLQLSSLGCWYCKHLAEYALWQYMLVGACAIEGRFGGEKWVRTKVEGRWEMGNGDKLIYTAPCDD